MDLPYNLDFLPIYAQSLALCSGGPLYDVSFQSTLLQAQENIALPANMPFPPPYPPWAVMLHAPICLFPIQDAANLFFSLNLFLYAVALLILSNGCSLNKRALLIVMAASLPTTIGLLTVGQMTMPIILALACIYLALKKQSGRILSIGISLLTFKPMLGVLTMSFIFGYIVANKPKWLYEMVKGLLLIWSILLLLSFYTEPAWLFTFTQAAIGMSRASINLNCDTCSSMSIVILKYFNIYSWTLEQFSILSVVLITALLAYFGAKAKSLTPASVVMLASTLTLLLPTYVRNYDYAILAVPLTLSLVVQANSFKGLVTILALMLTWYIALNSRDIQGITLWIPALLLLLVVPRASNLSTNPIP